MFPVSLNLEFVDASPGQPMDDNTDDIQAQILQTTLTEIETSRQEGADSTAAGSDESHDCCVICLDSISDACAALPCGHTHFDFLCLVSWLQEHPNCPLCKANVYKVRYADAQKGDAVYRVPNASKTRDNTGRDENAPNRTGQTHLNSASRRYSFHNGLLRDTTRRIPRPPPSPNEAIQRRRHIYRHQLYSLHIGSNRISQYRPPPTPVQLASTPHLISRARLWIRRELQVFSFLSDPDASSSSSSSRGGHTQQTLTDSSSSSLLLLRRRNNAEFLLEYIVAILKTVDLQGSAGQAESMLADFLGRPHARLFLHELRSWLRSPAASLAAWDREVQYPDPDPDPDPGSSRPRAEDESADRARVVHDEDSEVGDGGGRERRQGHGHGHGHGHEHEEGRSWRDASGDHWRAGAHAGERGKRKRRADDETRNGRVSRSKRERD